MRSDRLAEAILSLVAPADRVASAVGDLMEGADARGRVWFWHSVARLTISLLGRDLLFAPVAMAASAAFAWFLYMGLSLVLALVVYVVASVAWSVAYVLTNHTGLELLANMLRVRLEWPSIPAGVTYAIQAIVFVAIAPFEIGRGSAAYWRGHEVSLVLVMLLVWMLMSLIAPLVGIGFQATPAMMPVTVMFVLFGLLSERRRPATTS